MTTTSPWLTRALRLALSALLVASLAGCGHHPKRQHSATPGSIAASATATTSPPPRSRPRPVVTTGANVLPGAKRPVLPEGAKLITKGGARVFAIYALLTMNWAYSTMDTALLKAISAPGCKSCAKIAKTIDEVQSANNHFKGGHLTMKTITDVQTDPLKFPNADYAFDLEVHMEVTTIVDQNGKRVEGPFKEDVITTRFSVGWIDGGWKLVESQGVVSK